jgi:hypothetical protein
MLNVDLGAEFELEVGMSAHSHYRAAFYVAVILDGTTKTYLV